MSKVDNFYIRGFRQLDIADKKDKSMERRRFWINKVFLSSESYFFGTKCLAFSTALIE
jgi:hypothetical protein